uniref:CCHC-type domain-containing protein n=1 Tax=Cyanoderma ruficeps TaxID=181631 RepID=A0A8C3P2Z1_9PASS
FGQIVVLLGWMLESWTDCPRRGQLSKEIRDHVGWPGFGSFEPWVGKGEGGQKDQWEPLENLPPPVRPRVAARGTSFPHQGAVASPRPQDAAPPPSGDAPRQEPGKSESQKRAGKAAPREKASFSPPLTRHRVRREEGDEGPSSLYPLREVPMSTGVIGFVNVPINTSDVRAFKREMGKLMDDPLRVAERLDDFLGTSIYNYGDLCLIMRSLFNTEERDMIRRAAIRDWERRNPQGERGEQKWPNADPGWDPQTGDGRRNMMDLRNMIIQGIREAVPRGQNLSKILGECQKHDESSSEWIERLRRGLQTYSGMNPDSPVGEVLLKTQFVAKSWEDIRRKLEKIEKRIEKELQEFLREAQKVYERNKSQARVMVTVVWEAQKQDKTPGKGKAAQAKGSQGKGQAEAEKSSPKAKGIPFKCFYCKKKGHFRKDCLKRIKDEQVFKED